VVTYKNAGDTAEVEFTGSEEYLVVPYSSATQTAAAISFDIEIGTGGGGADGGIATEKYQLTQPLPLKIRNPKLWARWQQRLAVEGWLWSLGERAAKRKMSAPGANLDKKMCACTKSADCQATEVCHAGNCTDTVQVKVGEFSTGTIDAKVAKKGTAAAILVDSGDTVTQENIDKMLEKFDTLIYPRDTTLFGKPMLQDGTTPATDRNGDGLVWLVFTSKVADKGDVAGFFVKVDFADATAEANSNEADILYINSTLPDLEAANTTIAHEFQHLLSFGAKVYRPKVAGGQGTQEELWLDEGMSHFAEDASGYGGDNVILLDQEVFTSFNATSLLGPDDSAAMRGMAFTFVRYIFEQKGGASYGSDGSITDKGGAALLASIHTSDKRGVEAVAATYGPFKGAVDGWITAISLDGRGVTDYAKYVFQPLIDDPKTGNKVGLKIRGTRKDSSGTDVTLQGPLEEDLTANVSDTIPNATGKFFKLAGQTGKVNVTVKCQEADFHYAVIKLK